MNEILIAEALHAFLEKPSLKSNKKRQFVLLNGFDDTTYSYFLARLAADDNRLAGSPVIVRTTARINQYRQYALEEENAAATWYRNHVQPNHILILILNNST